MTMPFIGAKITPQNWTTPNVVTIELESTLASSTVTLVVVSIISVVENPIVLRKK